MTNQTGSMNLLVIGATGGVGQQVVRQALAKGHQVTALSRSALSLPLQHPGLRKVAGSFHDADLLQTVIPGHDAVIITASLGIFELKKQPDFYTRGTGLVIRAMQQHGVPRVVILSNLAAGDGHALLNPLERLFTFLFIREATADHTRQEQLARDSGLQWTVARPTRLTNGPARGRYQAVSGQKVPASISRADVADFLLESATTGRWLNRTLNLGG